ncbi:MAG: hypothetical protein GQ570_13725 [Helicobacteraceae bacterium]|nr:hypothetical protein [Helicobacteraceae bacterium]
MKKIFFILEGNNGATYIFNAKNSNAVSDSLKFYKARTVKQKVMKNALKLYLNALALLCETSLYCSLKDKNEIEQYLEKLTDLPMDFELDENSSILISPTRDKIIVHHHGEYFYKFAFGNSYKNVKNEASIYELLNRPLQNFKVSKFYDLNDRENEFCSFKLGSQKKELKSDINLTSALVEMFRITRQEKHLFSSYLEDLKRRYLNSGIACDTIEKVLKELEVTHENELIPLGLVHRDFKHWNINVESGLLIYDFEEAVTDGPPLEDLLNYHIDPIVRYVSPSEVAEIILDSENMKEYKRYLKKLEIALDFKVLLYCHLLERAIFWMDRDEKETSVKYCDLLEYIVMEHKEK